MPLPDLAVERVIAPAPARGPMCELVTDDTSVRLGLPGLGAVQVDRDVIRVIAPTEQAVEQAWARLGTWATAQALLARGLAVLSGAAIAREGRAFAVIGATRSGTSALAAQLTRHGCALMSDGFVAIRPDGTVLGGRSMARLDSELAERLFADRPQRRVATERPRSDVNLPSASDQVLAGYIAVGVRESASGVKITESPDEAPPPALRVACHVPGAARAEPPSAPALLVERGIPRTMEDLAVIGPPALAARLDALVEQWP